MMSWLHTYSAAFEHSERYDMNIEYRYRDLDRNINQNKTAKIHVQ